MKKEVFIMHDFKALCRQAHTLVIFKSLHEVPVFEKLLDTLAVCESDSDMAIEKYSDFVAELFAYSDNLTEYMLKLVLENENLFMLKKGEGKETGALLEECLANELAVIEELSQIPSDEIISKIDYDGVQILRILLDSSLYMIQENTHTLMARVLCLIRQR